MLRLMTSWCARKSLVSAWKHGTAPVNYKQAEERAVQCTHRVQASGHTQHTVSPSRLVTSTHYCCREILISFDRSGKSLLNESSCAQISGRRFLNIATAIELLLGFDFNCSAHRTHLRVGPLGFDVIGHLLGVAQQFVTLPALKV